MNGKSWSIPFGMVFKKYYCSICGEKLVKEKTHRVVTKDDLDYYQYHEKNMYPRSPVDVYSYRFRCNNCRKAITYNEQCILEIIQKKYNTKVLLDVEIDNYYEEAKIKREKHDLITSIGVSLFFMILCIILMLAFNQDKELNPIFLILFLIFGIIMIVNIVRSHNGKRKYRKHQDYSYSKQNLLEKLHTYCSNNKELITFSNKCYCFYCNKVFSSNEIKEYIGEYLDTALCPNCNINSIIPDAIDEELNENIIKNMNKYWF